MYQDGGADGWRIVARPHFKAHDDRDASPRASFRVPGDVVRATACERKGILVPGATVTAHRVVERSQLVEL